MTEDMFLEELMSLWVECRDGVKRHDLSEHIYRFSDRDQWVKQGDRRTDILVRQLRRIFRAAKSEVQEEDEYSTWQGGVSSLRIFIGENGTTGLAPPATMKGDMICETGDRSISRILRVSGACNEYDLIGIATHCDISQPGDILRIPPPAKDPRLKVYFPRVRMVALGSKSGAGIDTIRASLFEDFGDELDLEEITNVRKSSFDSRGDDGGWI